MLSTENLNKEKGKIMRLTEKEILCAELRKNELCNSYWSEEIEFQLKKDIQLTHEPVGDMAIYSKYFEFHTSYKGNIEELVGTTALIKLGITANQSEYDIKKAIAGTDCYHNVRIIVIKEKKEILKAKFRLWSEKETEYCGNENELRMLSQK